jgi:diadenosine tetraphosphate (Ap4A) HIT family hydrolase
LNQISCPFCDCLSGARVVAECNTAFAIEDAFPVSKGHHLIIPKRHVFDWFEMSSEEKRDAESLLEQLRGQIMVSDGSVTGFNVGMNCGESAGQTIMHAHIHLIPRRDGDVQNPRGGIRGCVPPKMTY